MLGLHSLFPSLSFHYIGLGIVLLIVAILGASVILPKAMQHRESNRRIR
jgi:hypothetical protein